MQEDQTNGIKMIIFLYIYYIYTLSNYLPNTVAASFYNITQCPIQGTKKGKLRWKKPSVYTKKCLLYKTAFDVKGNIGNGCWAPFIDVMIRVPQIMCVLSLNTNSTCLHRDYDISLANRIYTDTKDLFWWWLKAWNKMVSKKLM